MTSADDGVVFDIDADGDADHISWTAANSHLAFLAVDRDGDGQITNGRELFGNHTVSGIHNGFEALELLTMETNGGERRGSVSSDDPIFESLLLWTDRNHNGVSEPSELQPASDLLSEIGVGYHMARRADAFGNIFLYRGWAHIRTASGRNAARNANEDAARTIQIWHVLLVAKEP